MNPQVQETTTAKPVDQLTLHQLAEATTKKIQGTIIAAAGIILGGLAFFPPEPLTRLAISATSTILSLAGYNIRKEAADQIGLLKPAAA